MLESLYTIVSWVLIGVSSTFGIYFLALSVQKKSSLHNYSIARTIMAFAYLSLGIVSMIEYFTQPDIIDFQLFRFFTVFIASFQSFLFTYALTALCNIHVVTKKRILLETIPIFLFLVSGILGLIIFPGSYYFDFILYFFIIYYISSLIRYAYVFTQNYRKAIIRINNLYAEEANRFRWILISFIAALSLGVLALLLTMFYSFTSGVIFSILSACFYFTFGIRFINYAFLFQKFELLIDKNNDEPIASVSPYLSQLESNIRQWTEKKQYLQPEISIKLVAMQLNTNRTYLSNYINTCKKTTFKAWINNLRIEEAKRLLVEYPQSSIQEICDMVGFSDKSNFGKQFAIHTGKPPKAWQKAHIKI